METRLSEKEKELVAVAASVAAGCIPCTRYHVKAVQTAGATLDEVTGAVEVALRIKRGAAAVMEGVARTALGLNADSATAAAAGCGDRVSRLAAIAAAVAVNCTTSLERYVAIAVGTGIRGDEIRLVVGLAQMIRAKAAEKMDAASKADAAGAAADPPACGCGSSAC
ncbi:MAG: carboxymuconolactone decarboxylase family protein [Deltaproteobacteria bacterium]|nr:carboxymuconolactone decarboxylase family protein [Deltaproteobacteria bacterium]